MTIASTTIRVRVDQRERLRSLADGRGASMSATLDAALEALRRADFYAKMAAAERGLQADPVEWASHVAERDQWLNPELADR